MAYYNKYRRPSLAGLGGFTDDTPCASIPACDAYRKPGNYCATADGGYVTFNEDGTAYGDPSGNGKCPSTLDRIGSILGSILSPKPPTGPAVPVQTGMSTTTKLALAGGAVLVVALIARR